MEVVLDASQDALALTPRWRSDLQGEVIPTFPAIRRRSLDLIEASEQCDDSSSLTQKVPSQGSR